MMRYFRMITDYNVDTNGFHELLKKIRIKKPVIYVNYHPQTHLDLPLIF